MKTVWVLWWAYSDGSNAGVERAYADKERGEQDMTLLENSFTSKNYELVEVQLLGTDS